MAEQCDSADYVDLNGKRVTGAPHGHVLSAFKTVAIAWFCLYAGEEDAYEVSLRWLQNNILLNTDAAPVEALIYHVKEINDILPLCPSRKYLSDAPESLPAPRKLTEFELCTTVLASLMRHVLAQYNSGYGTAFA